MPTATPANRSSQINGSDFSARLSQLIDLLNVSQNEFARKIGSTSAFVSNLATGKSKPGFDFLQTIALTFDISLDWLILGKGTPHRNEYIDPAWFQTVFLRLALIEIAATGNEEARMLSEELLSDSPLNSTTPARQSLLGELATRTSNSRFLAYLYNQWLQIPDMELRTKYVHKEILQHINIQRIDPLISMVNTARVNAAFNAGDRPPGAHIEN